MSALKQVLFVICLGVFWGSSSPLSKLLGEAGISVTLIVLASGLGVGLGLMALQWAAGGRLSWRRSEVLYGFGCGFLVNLPFILSLEAIRHMPVALTAVIVSTTPLLTYALHLALRQEQFNALRLLALLIGLASCAAVIVTRPGASLVGADMWLWVTLGLPLLYAAYNVFTSVAWPKDMPPLTAGVVESFASALLGLPLLLLNSPQTSASAATPVLGYFLLMAITLMWVVERVCYFRMIRVFGPVTTVQAVYVSTPAAVLVGFSLFGETVDVWLLLALVLLMASLWLNNRAMGSIAPELETAA